MKKIITLLFLCFVCQNGYAQAVIRITAGTNLQTAIDNATVGTTFLVEPGSYGTLTITKRVALIGSGYLLNSNASASAVTIYFGQGSDNSLITGFDVNTINVGYTTAGSSHVNGITIQRNQIISLTLDDAGGTLIKQNLIKTDAYIGATSSSTLIKNNIILGVISGSLYFGEAVNNTILCNNTCSQTYYPYSTLSFVNNIIVSTCNFPVGQSYSTNNLFTNNLIKTTHFNADATNIQVANFNNVFVGFPSNTGSTVDGRYQLATNSPAKGAGTGGTDMGAFGGSEPYILQGIPIGPNVLSVIAPTGAAAGQTISVQIKAKVQN